MTDRINTLTVVLSEPTRTDDAQPIIDAITQMRGVGSVVIGEVDEAFGARQQERHRLRTEIVDVFDRASGHVRERTSLDRPTHG